MVPLPSTSEVQNCYNSLTTTHMSHIEHGDEPIPLPIEKIQRVYIMTSPIFSWLKLFAGNAGWGCHKCGHKNHGNAHTCAHCRHYQCAQCN